MAIITKHLWRSRDIWSGPALLAGISGLVLLGGEHWRLALRYDRAAIRSGEWWRLLSGNFAHLGVWHWCLNVAALVLLVLWCPQALRLRIWIWRMLVLCGGVGSGLYLLTVKLPDYVGLSGMIYGLFVMGLGPLALKGDRYAWLGLLFLVGRVASELYAGAPAAEEAWLGGRVVVESHLWGMLTAVLYGAVAGATRGWYGFRR